MPAPFARVVMLLSVALLIGAGAWWAVDSSQRPSADLVGETVVAAEITTTTSTTIADTASAPSPTTPPTTVPQPGTPRTISIPSLGVESPVVTVGLEDDGAMEVPGASDAGWYRHGPLPGSPTGNSVIAAHVDFNGERGVFFDVRNLEVGEEVAVADDRGMTHRFVVTERYQVDKDELPIEQLFVNDGPPGLTLITCGGEYDSSERHYDDNIVVRAVPA